MSQTPIRRSTVGDWKVTETWDHSGCSLPFFYPFNVEGQQTGCPSMTPGTRRCTLIRTEMGPMPSGNTRTAEGGPEVADAQNEDSAASSSAEKTAAGNKSKAKKPKAVDKKQKGKKAPLNQDSPKRKTEVDWKKIRKELKRTIYSLDENELTLLYRLYQLKHSDKVPPLTVKSHANLMELFWREANGTLLSVFRLFNLVHVLKKIKKEQKVMATNSSSSLSQPTLRTKNDRSSTDRQLSSNQKLHEESDDEEAGQNQCSVS